MKNCLPILAACGSILLMQGCTSLHRRDDLPSSDPPLPASFPSSGDTNQVALPKWSTYFQDPQLAALIRAALENNQELNILMQEIAVSKSDVLERKGALFPFVTLGGNAGLEKPGRFTRNGAVEDNPANEIEPGRAIPEPLSNLGLAADFDWEVDIWRKLRNERDAAIKRYLATREGRNFMVTRLVAEIAESYYELLSLDSRMAILKSMIGIQENALETVKLQKASGKATELAVKRFEAEVLKNQGQLFQIQQQVTVTENRINFLIGRYPQQVERRSADFGSLTLPDIHSGLPAGLLQNRPDVRRAELELLASGLDVKAAGARFYPSLTLSAALGLESFKLSSLATMPESLLYGAAANLAMPLINRSAIQAAFKGASARQVAAIYTYQQAVLRAYIEVVNQLAEINNLGQSFERKSKQVQTLSDSIAITGQLYNNARADYTEVLFTQRDALEAEMDLVEIKQMLLAAYVKAYKALGGGYDRDDGG